MGIMVKWLGTILCLIGIGLTSVNIYPLNIFLSLIGSGLWAFSGYRQDDYALFLVEAVAVFLYAFGVYWYITDRIARWGIM